MILSEGFMPAFTMTFWGACRTVTGSMHHVAIEGRQYLLDCGLYQGQRQQAAARNRDLPFAASDISGVVLSHAHIDHSGNLPSLGKGGFGGSIHTTPATIDLCGPMLQDTAHLQEKDAEFLSRRISRRKKLGFDDQRLVVPPLYTQEDATSILTHFRPLPLHTPREIGPNLTATLSDAGHMLGSACVLLETRHNGATRRLLFSGDIGRKGLPIIKDPDPTPPADYLIMESTYGNQLHLEMQTVTSKLVEAVKRTLGRGGHIIAPSFAVGRTQQVVLLLHQLIKSGQLSPFPIFVDSPLAINVTEVFREHTGEFDEEAAAFVERGEDPFGFFRLRYLRDASDSKSLNYLRVPYMVIAASGMCEGGRVLHHLRNGIEDPRNLILFTGYQAEHTLGRKIVDGNPEVPVFGEPMRVRAEIATISELSGHADHAELLRWMRPIAKGLKGVFLVHGEPAPQATLKQAIEEEFRIPVECPVRGQIFRLE